MISIFQKKIQIDVITLICLILMLLSSVVGIGYYYNNQINECTRSPLTYGAKQLENKYQVNVTGQVVFLTAKLAPILIFNSQNISTLN